MSTIPAQLRNFNEPGDEQPPLFSTIPPSHAKGHGVGQNNTEDGLHKMEINVVLSLAAEGTEDSYISPLRISHLSRQKSFNVARQKITRLRLDPGYLSVISLPLERLFN